jgi:hypothetical protein
VKKELNNYLPYLSLLAVASWFFRLLLKNSVNLFFFDQIDLVQQFLLKEKSFFTLFFFQYGPHRQGISFVIWDCLNSVFGYHAFIPVFISFVAVFLATLIALLLVKEIRGENKISDFIIPVIFLSLRSNESFFATANPSHGPFSLFLLLLFCLFFMKFTRLRRSGKMPKIKSRKFMRWRVKDIKLNLAMLTKKQIKLLLAWGRKHKLTFLYFFTCLLIFLLSFSGFGFVALLPLAIIGLLILGTAYFKKRKRIDKKAILILMAVLISSLLFFYQYSYQPAVDCFDPYLINIVDHLKFMTLMISFFMGSTEINNFSLVLGTLGFIVLIINQLITLSKISKVKRQIDKYHWYLIFLLNSFTLIFISLTAYGRTCLGLEAAFASRYSLYLIPGFLAVYFTLIKFFNRKNKMSKVLIVIFVLSAILFEINGRRFWQLSMYYWRDTKNSYLKCFNTDFSNIEFCEKKVNQLFYHDGKNVVREVLEHTLNSE